MELPTSIPTSFHPDDPLLSRLIAAGVLGGVPSYLLDFMSGAFPASFGSQPITFSRASSATRWTAGGQLEIVGNNVPALDHDPVTGARLGYLAERQKVNQALWSYQFDQANWNKNNILLTSGYAAPDGSNNAFLVARGSNASTCYTSQTQSGTIGTIYTISVFAKAATTGGRIGLRMQSTYPNRVDAVFDLSTGSVVGSNAVTWTNVSAGIIPCGNGWYRCYLTGTCAGSNLGSLYFGPTDDSRSVSGWESSSSVLSDAYIFGAMLETGGLSSYIPTTTAAATRQADTLTIPTAGWFNPNEGTFIVELGTYPGAVTTARRHCIYLNDANNNRLSMRTAGSTGSNFPGIAVGDGSSVIDLASGTTPIGSNERLAMSYSTDRGCVFSRNGVIATTASNYSGTNHPTLTVGPGDLHIKSLVYIPKFLTTP